VETINWQPPACAFAVWGFTKGNRKAQKARMTAANFKDSFMRANLNVAFLEALR